MIYIDSDTIWLEDPYALWSRFWVMPPEATIGIAAENIDPGEPAAVATSQSLHAHCRHQLRIYTALCAHMQAQRATGTRSHFQVS